MLIVHLEEGLEGGGIYWCHVETNPSFYWNHLPVNMVYLPWVLAYFVIHCLLHHHQTEWQLREQAAQKAEAPEEKLTVVKLPK